VAVDASDDGNATICQHEDVASCSCAYDEAQRAVRDVYIAMFDLIVPPQRGPTDHQFSRFQTQVIAVVVVVFVRQSVLVRVHGTSLHDFVAKVRVAVDVSRAMVQECYYVRVDRTRDDGREITFI
jgi:hypothetical protein